MKVLESRLEDRVFLVGDDLGAADVALAASMRDKIVCLFLNKPKIQNCFLIKIFFFLSETIWPFFYRRFLNFSEHSRNQNITWSFLMRVFIGWEEIYFFICLLQIWRKLYKITFVFFLLSTMIVYYRFFSAKHVLYSLFENLSSQDLFLVKVFSHQAGKFTVSNNNRVKPRNFCGGRQNFL